MSALRPVPGRRSSVRARSCLVALPAGYLLIAVIAGAPISPLTTPLPTGALPPPWATGAARALGLAHVGRPGLIAASLVVVALVLTAFVLLIVESWNERASPAPVLLAAGVSLA